MKQYFYIFRLSDGDDRANTNKTVMNLMNDGWIIKQMEHIPSTNEGNKTKFAASLAILFEQSDKKEID